MDKRKTLLAAIGISAIATGVCYSPYILLIPPFLYSIAGRAERKKSSLSAKRTENIASKHIARLMAQGSGLASKRKEFLRSRETEIPSWISTMLKRKALGEMDSGQGRENELKGILASHLNTGKSIHQSLALLSKRLDNEIRTEEKFSSKANGLKSLTYMGLSFFLPLFAGISSGILQTSLGFIGNSASGMQQGFLCVVSGYICITLYLSSFFSNPRGSAAEHMGYLLPSFSISAFIMLATAHYAAAIL